jgi:hypothetical protein
LGNRVSDFIEETTGRRSGRRELLTSAGGSIGGAEPKITSEDLGILPDFRDLEMGGSGKGLGLLGWMMGQKRATTR